jgi:scyllo-inositol 2-dehydrogenase (NADP+)
VRFEEHYDRYRPTKKVGAWREIPGPGSGILFDLGPHLIDHAMMLFGRPLAISADLRMERDGAITDDSFDLGLEYPQGMRAQLSATMLSLTPRPRYMVLGTKGSFIKRDFDPLENALRNSQVPADDSWMMEKGLDWGEASVWENGETLRSRVASIGDWRDFYLNVRDALLGKAELQVAPQQVVDVMVALELAQQSAAERRVVPWRNVPMEGVSQAWHET